ncbi:MAG TPA: chemotaxis protein CheD [Bacteroidales bacterium]|nr:chemotaxis protein CheD [Bacteroidales bacterium]
MNAKTHYLYPSALFASPEPYQITTILGSCVAVCLWDRVLQIGGMNHYMLPLWNGAGLASPKYGNIAIPALVEKLERMGSEKKNLVAKVFGGGEVISTSNSNFNIGARNIVLAQQTLQELNIRIVAHSYGGSSGRKILFYTKTGEVMHRFIQQTTIEPKENGKI